jgi:hypothetical protein
MNARSLKILLALPVAAIALVAPPKVAEAQGNAMSGKTTLKYTTRTILAVPDVEGHALMVGESRGTNTSTGMWEFMDGATATSIGITDLTKGNGPQSGYFILSKGADKTVVKVTGTVKTVLSPEGKPLTGMSGEWTYVTCAGVYAGCTGQGVYQGNFISQDEYIVEFKGVIVQ